jgi:dipeptidyl aminopeptidase/acylaminoacyl peptidase
MRSEKSSQPRVGPLSNNGRSISVAVLTLAVSLALTPLAAGQGESVPPGKNIEAVGIPPVPAGLARTVQRYTTAYGLPLAGWDPTKREIWLKNLTGDSASVFRVSEPGGPSQPGLYIPAGVYDLYYQPQGQYLIYNRDTSGNEAFQMYLYDIGTRKSTLLTDGKSRNTEPVWSNAGDRIIYSSAPAGGNGVSLYVLDPLDPKTNRLLAQSPGSYFKVYDWSPDDRQAVFVDYLSNTVSTFSLIDVATGERTLLSPKREKADDYYDSPQFSRDGKGIFVITDHDSDVRRLAYIDLATRQFKYLSGQKSNVEDFKIARDGKTLAFITNEEGLSRLHLLDTKTDQEETVTSLPFGIISDLKWHNNSQDLAFDFKSASTPTDVYSVNSQTRKVDQWVKGKTGETDITKIPEPELIHWKSFDGRVISGFLFRPPSKWTSKRPVVIDIHGGPEEQYRPSFWGQDNYLLNELGVAKIYPNVRGSSGYGKTFLNLDNGVKREDSVKDIGALLDWIKTQPYLDSERIMVTGASYGGYVALSVAANYPNRISAAQSVVGPSNLVTFLEDTEGWRRDVRRSEYGDERDPKIREVLERIAPLNNAQRIKKPLFIVQGKNDPRVKTSEAEQMIEAVKKNDTPVWYLLAKDEGHDFINQRNIDFQFYATVLFIQEYLLK